MNLIDNFFLANIYNNVETLFVIMIRVAGFFIVMPFFSGKNIPDIIKLTFTVVFSLMIFASGLVKNVTLEATLVGNVFLFIIEFFTGFAIGFVSMIIFSIVHFMGEMVDYQLGLSMASTFDPTTQMVVPILGNLSFYVIMLFFIQSGGLNSFLSIFIGSYKIISPGEAHIISNGAVTNFIIIVLSESISVGIKFALPIVGSVLVIDMALGILVKAVPQVNVFVVGMPLKLFLGLTIFYLISPIFVNLYDYIFNESYIKMIDIMQGMSQ